MSDEQQLWEAEVSVLALGETLEDAKENIKNGYVLVDDIIEVKPDTLEHIEDNNRRRKMMTKIVGILRRREQHPAASW